MHGLLPIIRRARRPLYPPSVVELPPSAPPVESVASVPVVVTPEPAVESKAKKGKAKHVRPEVTVHQA